jgi:cytochrome c556
MQDTVIHSDHSTDDDAVTDTLVNGDDNDTEAEAASADNFVWENMSNYKEQREQFRGRHGPKSAEKKVQGIW